MSNKPTFNFITENIDVLAINHRIDNTKFNELLCTITDDLYHSARTPVENITRVCEKYDITEKELDSKFCDVYGVTVLEYCENLSEAKQEINEDFGSFVSGVKDNVVSKYGIGASKYAAQGRNDTRAQAQDLFNKWTRASARANATATADNLKTFLLGMKIAPDVVSKAMTEFQKYSTQPAPTTATNATEPTQPALGTEEDNLKKLYASVNSVNEAGEEPVLVGSKIKDFLSRVAQLNWQNLGSVAAKNAQAQAKKIKQSQTSQNKLSQNTQNSEKTQQLQQQIAGLSPAERTQFFTSLAKQYGG